MTCTCTLYSENVNFIIILIIPNCLLWKKRFIFIWNVLKIREDSVSNTWLYVSWPSILHIHTINCELSSHTRVDLMPSTYSYICVLYNTTDYILGRSTYDPLLCIMYMRGATHPPIQKPHCPKKHSESPQKNRANTV